jgi:hypothetical protein
MVFSSTKRMEMVYIPRALRRKWANDAFEAEHPELAQERVRTRAASLQALADTRAKFPVLTPENFEAANAYREARIKELMGR